MFKIFLVLALVLVLDLAHAASVTIPLGQVGSAPAASRSLTITPYSVYQLGLIPLTDDRTYGTSDTNGNFVCTLPPGTYQCDVAPVWGQAGKTEFYFYVDPSNATQNAAANLLTTTPNTFPPPQYAYSAAASDARFAPIGPWRVQQMPSRTRKAE